MLLDRIRLWLVGGRFGRCRLGCQHKLIEVLGLFDARLMLLLAEVHEVFVVLVEAIFVLSGLVKVALVYHLALRRGEVSLEGTLDGGRRACTPRQVGR